MHLNKKVFIDLSHKLHTDMQVYPGDPPFSCSPFAQHAKEGFSAQSISMGSHTGTHIDAPYHFFSDGKTIDELPLSTFVGPALVVNLTNKGPREKIVWDDLAPYSKKMGEGIILLLWTDWSRHWCTPAYYEHPFLDRIAAEKIIQTGIRVVGLDTLNPDQTPINGTEGGSWDWGAHEVILGSGGLIAENLTNLRALEDSEDIVVSFIPLKLTGGDGSPIRAHAWKVIPEGP